MKRKDSDDGTAFYDADGATCNQCEHCFKWNMRKLVT